MVVVTGMGSVTEPSIPLDVLHVSDLVPQRIKRRVELSERLLDLLSSHDRRIISEGQRRIFDACSSESHRVFRVIDSKEFENPSVINLHDSSRLCARRFQRCAKILHQQHELLGV